VWKAQLATVAFVVDGAGLADETDFVAAWRRVEQLDKPPSTRGRAFALWVGLFDVADEHGYVRLTTKALLERFEIARNSLFDYRSLLEAAALVELHRSPEDKRTTLIRLTPPARTGPLKS
jgi:hypothetical protein